MVLSHEPLRERLARQAPPAAPAAEVVEPYPTLSVTLDVDKWQLELGHASPRSQGFGTNGGTDGGMPGMTMNVPSGSTFTAAISSPAFCIALTVRSSSICLKRADRRTFLLIVTAGKVLRSARVLSPVPVSDRGPVR